MGRGQKKQLFFLCISSLITCHVNMTHPDLGHSRILLCELFNAGFMKLIPRTHVMKLALQCRHHEADSPPDACHGCCCAYQEPPWARPHDAPSGHIGPYSILRSAKSDLLCKAPSLRLVVVMFITFWLILPGDLASTGGAVINRLNYQV